MQPHEFCHHFRSSIRVQLDWKQLCSSDWSIEHSNLTIPTDSSSIFTPWYALKDGNVCCYSDPGAQPQSVVSVAESPELRSHHSVYNDAPNEQLLVLPAYKLSNDSLLLLDGNHRVVATHIAGVTLSLEVFAICGPLDRVVLPDLVHWS